MGKPSRSRRTQRAAPCSPPQDHGRKEPAFLLKSSQGSLSARPPLGLSSLKRLPDAPKGLATGKSGIEEAISEVQSGVESKVRDPGQFIPAPSMPRPQEIYSRPPMAYSAQLPNGPYQAASGAPYNPFEDPEGYGSRSARDAAVEDRSPGLSREALRDLLEDTKLTAWGLGGSGKHLSLRTREVYQVLKMTTESFAMNQILYQLALN